MIRLTIGPRRLTRLLIRGQWGVQVRLGGQWLLTELRTNKRDNARRARSAERVKAGADAARVVFVVTASRRRKGQIDKTKTAEVPLWARQLLATGKRHVRPAVEAAATRMEASARRAAASLTQHS